MKPRGSHFPKYPYCSPAAALPCPAAIGFTRKRQRKPQDAPSWDAPRFIPIGQVPSGGSDRPAVQARLRCSGRSRGERGRGCGRKRRQRCGRGRKRRKRRGRCYPEKVTEVIVFLVVFRAAVHPDQVSPFRQFGQLSVFVTQLSKPVIGIQIEIRASGNLGYIGVIGQIS